MDPKSQAVIEGAILVARRTRADAVILATVLPEGARILRETLDDQCRIITATPFDHSGAIRADIERITLPEVRLRRRGRAKVALLEGLAAGLLNPGERVIIVSGDESDGAELDTIAVVEIENDAEFLDSVGDASLAILQRVAEPAVFDTVLGLCVQLGREGKEGRPVGLLITLGAADQVLERSNPIVLNPFQGHPQEELSILDPAVRRAIREFSGMDGAFVLEADGTVVAAGRYLQESAPEDAVPTGLGARHRAAAGITAATGCIAFVVSESTGDTRVFGGGHLLMTIQRTD